MPAEAWNHTRKVQVNLRALLTTYSLTYLLTYSLTYLLAYLLPYILLTHLLTYSFTYLITYLLTYSMEQSPSWEANRFLVSQEITRILWNPKVHYGNHKCPSLVPILSQLDPVHTPTSHFLKIHLNIMVPSSPRSLKSSLSLRYSHQNPVYASPLPHTRYMPRPSHVSPFYYPNIIGRSVQIIKLLIM